MIHLKDIPAMLRLDGKVAFVIGGGGVLGAAMSRAVAAAGAKVWVGSLHEENAVRVASAIREEGGDAEPIQVDVLSRESLEAAHAKTGTLDILVNGAGGNIPAATTSAEQPFFDLPTDALDRAVRLNLIGGAVLPCQVFGRAMKDNSAGGVIINVSSMAAVRPLTRVAAYAAAKAAVSNFTQWLAVHVAQEYNPRLRVNALAPGFFLTEQNRYLLTEGEGLSPRGKQIIDHTPRGRFGEPDDLAGATIWLCSDAAAFVTGVVVPVDGGFSAFSGV